MNSRLCRRLGLAIFTALAISACSGEDESESLERAVVIARENVASIAVQSANDKRIFAPGENWDFSVVATRADGTTFDATSRVDWRSSDTSVARINGGQFNAGAVTGVSPVIISADWAQFSASLEVNVSDAALVSITTSLASQDPVNECLPTSASAVGNYSDGTVRPLNGLGWTSTAPDIARIDDSGNILTLNAGASDITASLGGVVSQPAPLNVSDTLSGITVSGEDGGTGSTTVQVGGAASLAATGIYSNGTPAQTITPAVNWSSANDAAVRVDAAGRLSGVAPGSAEITASCGGLDGTISANAIGINDIVIVNPRTGNLVAGDRVELELYGVLSNGERGTVDFADGDERDEITWQIPRDEGDTIATIDGDGFLEINTLTNIVSLTTVRVNAQYIQGTQTFNTSLLIQVGPTR
ncbi:Ig-like domain-containing protein [Allohahella marinimesophila]|uniref:BIG2 domain-containing protein n=1 Tax=Allohahella marinimesophila TaxID=1054972 RepID=A0ABP7NLK8_9GAMM